MSTKSSRNGKVSSPAATLPWRGVLARNPSGVLTVVCMLLVVVWSHVLFYQSTIVRLPPTTSTASPHDNVSRPHQITSPTGRLNASTSSQRRTFNSTTAQHSRMSVYSGIVIRNRSAIPSVAGRPKNVDVALGTFGGNQVDVRDRNASAAVWNKWRRSRLLAAVDNQSLATAPSSSSTSRASTHRLPEEITISVASKNHT